MKSPFRKNPLAVAEVEIQKFENAIAKIDAKIGLTEREIDRHRAARRAHILSDPEAEIPAETRHGLALAEDLLRSTHEERAEMVSGLEELRHALVAARAKEEREAAAKVDEALADFVDRELAPEVAKAAAALGKACSAYLAKMPEGLAVVESREWSRPRDHARRHADHFSREELLTAIVAESLFAAAPGLFEHQSSVFGRVQTLGRLFDIDKEIPQSRSDGTPPAAIRDPARVLLSDRLRARAAAKRAGAPAGVDAEPAEAPMPEPDQPANVEIFVLKDFAYVENDRGGRALCGRRWSRLVPEPVADAAVEAGLALRTNEAKGQDAFNAEKQYRKNSMSIPESGLGLADCFDLGDVLGLVEDPGEDLAAAE
ncbi:hypothetical protein NKH37_15740 [Mesorhizobium sp. M1217]|uniref:hypothetical protein n=1 Tax=Mesorhizobium sp. M1217 TaxID=2957070 RepID=UPI00333D3631